MFRCRNSGRGPKSCCVKVVLLKGKYVRSPASRPPSRCGPSSGKHPNTQARGDTMFGCSDVYPGCASALTFSTVNRLRPRHLALRQWIRTYHGSQRALAAPPTRSLRRCPSKATPSSSGPRPSACGRLPISSVLVALRRPLPWHGAREILLMMAARAG